MKANIEIPVADLKMVLPGLSKIVSRKSTLPSLGCIKVSLGQDRHLRLQATNLDQFVTARLNKEYQGNAGDMLVLLEDLSSIVKRCPANDSIVLSVDGKQTSMMYTGAGTRIRKSLKHVPLDEFPPEMEVQAEPIKLDEAFKEALQQALDCASTDGSRYDITGACLDVSNKEAHYVVGTDGRHIFCANSFLFDVPESIIVPPGKFLTWSGFIEDGPWTLQFQPLIKSGSKAAHKPAWVRLDSEHWTYVSKPIEGNYPNWKSPIPEEGSFKSRITLAEPGVNVVLEALPLLPGENDFNGPVTLEMKGDALFLKARSTESQDWTEVPVPAKVSGLPVSVALNRVYLAKALKFGLTQIGIVAGNVPIVFYAKGKMLAVAPIVQETAKRASAPNPSTSPPENSSAAATPPPAESTATTAESPERNQESMAQTNGAAVTHGTVESQSPQSQETPAIDQILAQVGTVREGVKKVLEDLGTFDRLARRAAREQRLNEKEINRARSTLRSLKSVEL